MANPHNPIEGKAKVNANDGLDPVGTDSEDYEISRRIQVTFNEWLKLYFGGESFETPTKPVGTTRTVTLEHCDLLFGQGTPESPSGKPLLHFLEADVSEAECREKPGFITYRGEMTWNVLIRVAPILPVKKAEGEASSARAVGNLCRRVASQLSWLLKSSERQALSYQGVTHLKVLSGPVEIPSGGQFVRQMVFSHKYSYDVDLNV